MDLKAFKGLPHEFGGIDYTEGSEVEGGEFAVKIGKSGNEYIFDKNSSEGEKLSKEYKRLDMNGRLSEDDPLSLETFDQIAREEALKHAQRSVNEKGIDPFRNMYDQGGQAANGGVKYATGGPKQMGAPESRMRTTSFGDQEQRIESEQVGRKDITKAQEIGLLMGDIFLGLPMASFTGKSFSETVMADTPYRSSEATRNAAGDDTMLGTGFGNMLSGTQNTISNMGTDVLGGMADGGAMPKNKYAQGGASGQKDMYMGGGGSSGGGGGMPWIEIVKAVKGIKDNIAIAVEPAINENIEDDRYIDEKPGGPRRTLGGNVAALVPSKQKQQEENPWAIPESGLDQEWMMDDRYQLEDRPIVSEVPMTEDAPLAEEQFNLENSFYGNDGGLTNESLYSTWGPQSANLFSEFKNGGAKKGVYGYYANGGGKKKEESYDAMKDPVQWDIMQNYIASDDTKERMSEAAVGSGDEMYAPYRVDNTCVAGVNCFEDLADVKGMPDFYNNRALKEWFESKEGKKSFRKVKNAKPGDYVQYEKTIHPRGINYPYHLGMVTGDDRYLGDGSSNAPLHYNTLYKEPDVQAAGVEFTNTNPYFYRIRDKENRQKVLNAALQAKQEGKDVIRPVFSDEEELRYLPIQQYRKNSQYPIAGL